MAYAIRLFQRMDTQNESLGKNDKRTPESEKRTISFRQSFLRRIFFYGPCGKTKKPLKVKTHKELHPAEGSNWSLVMMEDRSIWDWSFFMESGPKEQDTRRTCHIPSDPVSPNLTNLINVNNIHFQSSLNPNTHVTFIVPTRRSNWSSKMNKSRNFDGGRKNVESGIGAVDPSKKFSSSKPTDSKAPTGEKNHGNEEGKRSGNSGSARENEESIDHNEEPAQKLPNPEMGIGLEVTRIQPSTEPFPNSDLYIRTDCTNESLTIVTTENRNEGFTNAATDSGCGDDDDDGEVSLVDIDLHKTGNHSLLKPNSNANVIVPTNKSESTISNEDSVSEIGSFCKGSENVTEKFPLTPNPNLTKPMLVIDLDETLIHSSLEPIPNPDFIVPVEMDGIIHEMYVAKRPHVDEFLVKMGQLYECVLWTASLATYADPVTDILDKFGVFNTRLFRSDCVSYRGQYVKDLGQLGRSLQQVTILDNSPMCYFFHRENGVPITSWYDDVKDNELLSFIPFFERLSRVDNVPSVLRNCRRPFYSSTFDQGLITAPLS